MFNNVGLVMLQIDGEKKKKRINNVNMNHSYTRTHLNGTNHTERHIQN